jgi:gliding motility-associated-like protein
MGKPLILCEGNVLVLTTKKFFEAIYFWTSPTGIRYDGREVAIHHSDTLASGAYILTTNLDGCLRHDTIQVKISPTIKFAANVKNPTCFQGDDGLIRIISISGTPLKAIFNGKEFVNTQFNFSNLKKGVYDVILKNSDSCSRKLTFTVLEPPQIHVFAGEDTITSPFQAVQLQATGDGKLYKWEPVEGLNDPLLANPIANPKQTTIYKVTGIDSLGCLATDEVLVTVIEDFTVPRILSPNGDKTNDLWQIENLAYFPNHEIKVWNRWGQEVFSATNYQNDWDGTQGGNPLPEGAYYFLITAANGEKKVSGALNIAR